VGVQVCDTEEKAKWRARKQMHGCQGLGMGVLDRVMELFFVLIEMGIAQCSVLIKSHRTAHWKRMNLLCAN
jgi:hypothetical protein